MKKIRSVVVSVVFVFIGILTPHFVCADDWWYGRYRPHGYHRGYYSDYHHGDYHHGGYHRRAYYHGGGYYYPKYHKGYDPPRYYCNFCFQYHPRGWYHRSHHY